jgi:hypothetical protein
MIRRYTREEETDKSEMFTFYFYGFMLQMVVGLTSRPRFSGSAAKRGSTRLMELDLPSLEWTSRGLRGH